MKILRPQVKSGVLNTEDLEKEMMKRCQSYKHIQVRTSITSMKQDFICLSSASITWLVTKIPRKTKVLKHIRSKNRITLAVSANATAIHFLPPFFMGKAMLPMSWELASREERIKIEA